MTKTMAMLDADPSQPLLDKQLLARCIDTCLECGQACTACADADLDEQMVSDLVKCARLNLDCADMCQTTARVLTRQTGYDRDLTRAVVHACAPKCAVVANRSARRCWQRSGEGPIR